MVVVLIVCVVLCLVLVSPSGSWCPLLLSNYLTEVIYLNSVVAVFCVSSSRCSILRSVIVSYPGYTHILFS